MKYFINNIFFILKYSHSKIIFCVKYNPVRLEMFENMWRQMNQLCLLYSETLNKEYIGRIYEMSSWQFFNEFFTILRKFQYLRK